MPRYAPDSKDRVKDAVDMVDLVQTRTELKRSGPGRYTGRCCFHEERTPSLSVDADRKLYHCFGCQAGGDCITFVQETEGTDFNGALEYLAGRYGVTLEILDDDPKKAAARKREAQLLGLTERAASFYEKLLWSSPEAETARNYLLGRGLDEEALKTYRVGWAPEGWDRLVSASAKAGVEPRMLEEAGLAMRKRESRGYNDRFHGRITFPLCDGRGQVRGFGARAMKADQQPKYLNTSENAIFHKGQQLFGLHLARSAAAKSGIVVLVEGYTDVIALHQIGIQHVVALMGTAMTPEQVGELARLAPLLVLALDPDGAGEAAMEKAAGLAKGSRLELRVAELPDGRDPAELVQDGRAEELRAALDQPMHFTRFRVERILKNSDLSTAELRDEALAKLAPVLAELSEGALREELVARVADRMALGPAIVDRIVRGAPRPRPQQQDVPPRGGFQGAPGGPQGGGYGGPGGGEPNGDVVGRRLPHRLDPYDEQERTLLALMLALGTEGRRHLGELDPQDLRVPHVRAVLEWLQSGGDEGGQLPADDGLSEVARDVILRSGTLDARPAVLEVELAQLALRRLERQIEEARRAGQPIDELRRSATTLRDRLDEAMVAAMDL
ncbi:MAG: DNA primase [Solirubrobacteraceae bacterium]|nr:DNA primase [Solirubrobacteraceae bacterium]